MSTIPRTPTPKTVVYIAENTESAQFRYRVKNVADALASSCAWRPVIFLRQDLSTIDFSKVSLLVIARQTAKNRQLPSFIRAAQRQGIKVAFDLDDLIFDYRDLFLIQKTTHEKSLPYWLGYIWGIRNIARLADGFLTTNNFLAEKLKRSFKKPVAVIPNSLNHAQIVASEKALKAQKPHAGFRLGYFSGSPTHTNDFRLIEPELLDFLECHPDASLKIVGYMDLSSRVKSLVRENRISFTPPVDYLKLQSKIASVDVNLAPLVENDFTNCKSELKFFEAAIAETTTIASPTFAYKNTIADGKTGLLARPGQWLEKLEYLYQNSKENRKLALAAKKFCLETYYGKNFLNRVESAYNSLLK